jgi:hypothetical protein
VSNNFTCGNLNPERDLVTVNDLTSAGFSGKERS